MKEVILLLIKRLCVLILLSGIIYYFSPNIPADRYKNISIVIMTGVLALGAFLINVRTFLVFKLHETVYGVLKYQERIQKISGTPQVDVYAPLKVLDGKLGSCIFDCGVTLALLWLAILFGNPSKGQAYMIVADCAFASILWLVFSFLCCIQSINRNFQAIIVEWGNLVVKPDADKQTANG